MGGGHYTAIAKNRIDKNWCVLQSAALPTHHTRFAHHSLMYRYGIMIFQVFIQRQQIQAG